MLYILLWDIYLFILWQSNGTCFSACLYFFVFLALCSVSQLHLSPLLRPVPVGEQFIFRWPLGPEPLAAGGAGSLQPGHGCVPVPQAKRQIHHLAHRERQTSACPLLYRHAATHNGVSTCFVQKMTQKS